MARKFSSLDILFLDLLDWIKCPVRPPSTISNAWVIMSCTILPNVQESYLRMPLYFNHTTTELKE
jgi:hypothetical protein